VPHYVVLGAGFGALTAVSSLRRQNLDAEITLIAPQPRFLYYPSLIWVPSGFRTPEDLTVDIRDFLARNGVTYRQAAVERLEDGGRTVVTDAGRIANDGLIVATGGRFLQQLPGIEHVLTVCQGGRSAQAIGERIQAMDGGRIALGFAGNPKHRPAMRGGAMFELMFCIDNQLRREGRRDRFELAFFTPNPQPGRRLGDRAVAGLMKRLDAIGVEKHLGHPIQRFEADRVVTEGGEIGSDLTVFMPGMTGPAWAADGPLPRTESGHIEVDARAKVPGLDAVYAVGDAAAFPGPQWQAKQAHAADVQAGTAAANLADELAGRAPRRSVRHEIVCILDSLQNGVFVFRNDRVQLVAPPLRIGHWAKIALEKFYLYKYGPRGRRQHRPAGGETPAQA
jgi:sulfide:quinone oxidoreductase